MKTLLLPAIAALILLSAAAMATAPAAQRPVAPPATVIAVVDLEKAVNGLNEWSARQVDLQNEAAKIKKRIEDLEKQLVDDKKNGELLPAGPDRKAAEEKLKKHVFEYKFEKQFAAEGFDEMKGDLLRELYQRVNTAAAVLAKKNGYTMVLASDEMVEIPNGSFNDVRRTVSLKRMLFVDPSHDITDELVLMMNNEYNALHAGAPAATPPTPPAASAKPPAKAEAAKPEPKPAKPTGSAKPKP